MYYHTLWLGHRRQRASSDAFLVHICSNQLSFKGNNFVLHGAHFNSLWPSDTTLWRHKSGSTLAQVMACCLTAPSHYLNQCWLIISKVQWHSSEGNFTTETSAINHKHYLEKYSFKISFKSPRGWWVNMTISCPSVIDFAWMFQFSADIAQFWWDLLSASLIYIGHLEGRGDSIWFTGEVLWSEIATNSSRLIILHSDMRIQSQAMLRLVLDTHKINSSPPGQNGCQYQYKHRLSQV